MRYGYLGAVAGLAVSMAACGGAEAGDETGELAQAHENEAPQCEQNRKECTRIEADQNITHVFLNFKCDPGDFRVTVETDQFGEVDVTDRLKDNGGPCNEIDRDFWIEIPGPDDEVKVCIEFEDEKAQVKVSYKAADVCEKADVLFEGERCQKCEEGNGGYGGNGGNGGNGGGGYGGGYQRPSPASSYDQVKDSKERDYMNTPDYGGSTGPQ